jgi:putative methyltransferase (TIGR04325 family)
MKILSAIRTLMRRSPPPTQPSSALVELGSSPAAQLSSSLVELDEAQWRAERRSYTADETVARFCVERARGCEFSVPLDPSFAELAFAASQGSSILDFGGGAGMHGMMLRRLLPNRLLTYHVVETPETVRLASATGISFSTAIPADRSFDVVFSSGTLQYMDDPIATTSELVSLDATILLLTRNAFAERPRYFRQVAPLFDHGGGTIPPGFENRPIVHYPQAYSLDAIRHAIEDRYDIVLMITNRSGAFGLTGVDLFCRKRA